MTAGEEVSSSAFLLFEANRQGAVSLSFLRIIHETRFQKGGSNIHGLIGVRAAFSTKKGLPDSAALLLCGSEIIYVNSPLT
jgi:hypothetical protein